MHRVVLKRVPLEAPARFPGLPRLVQRILCGLLLIQFAFVGTRLALPLPILPIAHWPEGLLLVLATAATSASLTCRLPGQNVLVVAILIAVMGGAAACLGTLTGIPFGPYTYTARIGQQLVYPLPWAVPMIWLVVLLNARDVSRLILRPWRQAPAYGFWLLGLTVLLVVLLDFALEPFAAVVKQYWTWKPTRLHSDWYGAPWVNFLGWGVTALLILFFVTPWLLSKKPGKPPPAYHPLLVWVLLDLLLVTGCAIQHLWLAVALGAAQTVLVAALALHGARK